jgi:HAD superfamily hydrolase (TIGR01450 family)
MSLRDWFFSKRIFLFDLDGTLVLGKRKLPGATRLLKELQSQEKKIFYFSNNSSRSDRQYVQKLRGFGFSVKPNQVLLSTHSLIRYLEAQAIRRIFLLGTPAMKRMIESQSRVRVVATRAQAVVVGFDRSLNFKSLTEATRLLADGLPMIVTHPDRFCPTDQGPEPDCGAIAALLTHATGVPPQVVLGKPSEWMIRELKSRLPFRADEVMLVGDRLTTDIRMAKDQGFASLFVLSGDHQRADVSKFKIKPTRIAESVKELL